MMVEKEDLGLSLSLRTTSSSCTTSNTTQHSSLQLNLMMTPSSMNSSPSPSPFFLHNKLMTTPPPPPSTPWNINDQAAFGSSDRNIINNADHQMYNNRGEMTRSFLRGIDVNRMPAITTTAAVDCEEDEEEEEEAGVSSPNSTVSSIISGNKRSERDMNNGGGGGSEDNDIELLRDCSRGGGGSDEEDGDTSRKKLRLSKDQSAILEESFKEHNTLNPKQKLALAKQLNLRPRQVEVWFQNRRARTKLKQTEVDCEFLKRCCENLTEENRRLQKEVQELRALKLSPQFYMQMTPPTTLTMCPSCERVGNAAPPATASHGGASASHHHHHQHHQRALPINAWAPNPIHQRRP